LFPLRVARPGRRGANMPIPIAQAVANFLFHFGTVMGYRFLWRRSRPQPGAIGGTASALMKRTSGLGANCFRRRWKEGAPFPPLSIPTGQQHGGTTEHRNDRRPNAMLVRETAAPCRVPQAKAEAKTLSVSGSRSSSTVLLGTCTPAKRFAFLRGHVPSHWTPTTHSP